MVPRPERSLKALPRTQKGEGGATGSQQGRWEKAEEVSFGAAVTEPSGRGWAFFSWALAFSHAVPCVRGIFPSR